MPASGKTTAAKNYVDKNSKWKYVYSKMLVDNERFKFYLNKIFFENEDQYLINFQVEASICRFLQNYSVSEHSVCDNDLFSIWAYSRMLVSQGRIQQQTYETLYALVLSLTCFIRWPQTVVLFRCDPAVARRRVLARSRKHEIVTYTENTLSELERHHRHILTTWPDSVGKYEIDTTHLTHDEIAKNLGDYINAN